MAHTHRAILVQQFLTSRLIHAVLQFAIFSCGLASKDRVPAYNTSFFDQPVDHFNFASSEETFKQRYLTYDSHWQRPAGNSKPGPIFFYTGNEANITEFAEATGFVWELAPKLGALVVFAEARYYGDSLPPDSEQAGSYKYLSSQQLLADFANLVRHLRDTLPGGWAAPVIAFGGSYGGMLAAWLRYQFPHLVDGALASSAPVAGFAETGVYDVVGRDFARHGCASGLLEAFSEIWGQSGTGEGRRSLERRLSLCAAAGSSSQLTSRSDVVILMGWLQKQLFTLAELDYPSFSEFIGVTLPPQPVRSACSAFNHTRDVTSDLVQSLAAAVGIVLNHTGQAGQCFRWQTQGAARRLTFMDFLPGFIEGAWIYQRCSQVYIPYAARDDADLDHPQVFLGCKAFPPNCWNASAFRQWCRHNYGVSPRPDAELTYFGGGNLTAASNIIFSNGDLDPWSAGGIHQDISSRVVALPVEGGAHHLDLRFSDPGDPPSVVAARAEEEAIISQWVREKHLRSASRPSSNFFI